MNVRELKQQLEAFDDDLPVWITSVNHDCNPADEVERAEDLRNVTKVYIHGGHDA